MKNYRKKQRTTTELWKLHSKSGYYVSSHGRIFIPPTTHRAGRVTKGTKRSDGYMILGNNYYVHHLVAECFLPNPYKLPQINHIDEDKSNNNVNNLERCDAHYNLTYNNIRQRAAKKRQKPILQYTKDNELIAQYESIKEAAEAIGRNASNIVRCLKGINSTAYNYKWSYVTILSKELTNDNTNDNQYTTDSTDMHISDGYNRFPSEFGENNC